MRPAKANLKLMKEASMDGSPLSSEFWSWVRETWSWVGETHSKNPDIFALLAILIAALLAFIAASTAAWAALRQAKIARLRHEEQTEADLQRRITENFTKAVDQLGSDKLQVRLDGIYTLERILHERISRKSKSWKSRESEPNQWYWPVMETLTGFVRERARWKEEQVRRKSKDTTIPKPPTDVAAVLTVIMNRDPESRKHEQSKNWTLDFTSTDLRGAALAEAHLEGAALAEAHLERADLENASVGLTLATGRLPENFPKGWDTPPPGWELFDDESRTRLRRSGTPPSPHPQ
jgi:hypothetical protein